MAKKIKKAKDSGKGVPLVPPTPPKGKTPVVPKKGGPVKASMKEHPGMPMQPPMKGVPMLKGKKKAKKK